MKNCYDLARPNLSPGAEALRGDAARVNTNWPGGKLTMSKQPVTERSASEQSTRNGIARPDPADENEFRALLDQWDRDTAVLSDASRILGHPAYQKIVAMGQRAVP